MATNFELNDKTYSLCTGWEDLTLGQWIDIQRLYIMKETFDIEEIYFFKIMDILCNAKEGELDELPMEKVNEMSKELSFLDTNFTPEVIDHIHMNGVDYVFNTNLNKLTSGEYISIKMIEQHEKIEHERIAKILAILIRPGYKDVNGNWKQNKFNTEDLDQRAIDILDIKVTSVLGAYNFFLSGTETSKHHI